MASSQELTGTQLDNLVERLEGAIPGGSLPTQLCSGDSHSTEIPSWAQSLKRSVDSIQAGQLALSDSISEFNSKIESSAVSQYQWKKEGLRKQFEVTDQIGKKFTAAEMSLKAGQVDATLKFIHQGKKLTDERLHCLKIADLSPGWWETVNEYLASPLARDDEDDRRIKRAEKVAMETLKEKTEARKNAARKGMSPYYRANKPATFENQNLVPVQPVTAPMIPELMQYKTLPIRPAMPVYQANAPAHSLSNTNQTSFVPQFPPPNQQADICFFCGQRGHWADSCPERKNATKKCKFVHFTRS